MAEGPAPTDGAFQAANSVAEGLPSNRRLLYNYMQEMKMRNPEVSGHPSQAWINSYVQESDIGDQNQALADTEDHLTLSALKEILDRQEQQCLESQS